MLSNGGPFVILTVCFLYSLAAPSPQNLVLRLFGADKLGLESAHTQHLQGLSTAQAPVECRQC